MKRDAFTLIELIIVVSIIMLLVGFLIIDFGGAKRTQEMNVATQNFLALTEQARSQVYSGKIEENDGAYLCLGLYLKNGFAPKSAQMLYLSEDKICDFNSATQNNYGLLGEKVLISELNLAEGLKDEIWIMFSPPKGEVLFYDASGSFFSGDLKLIMEHVGDKNFTREFSISALTNRISFE